MISQQNQYAQQQQQQQHYHYQHQQQQQAHAQQQQQQHTSPVPVFNGVDPLYPGLQQIYNDPPIYRVENFLTPEECDHLVHVASDSFTPAPVVGVGSGVVSETRTSSTCYLAKEDLPGLVRKISRLTRKPICHMELPQVGRYLNTQQYLPHFDAFNMDEADGARFAANGGQRTVTVLVYLNDVANGGHTAFPKLPSNHRYQHQQLPEHFKVKPVKGMALVFFPATVDGHLDPRTLHAALPAIDTKFVSQIWIRQGNYYGQAGKRLPSSGIMGGPQLTPQETRAYTATTIADVLQQQQQTHQQQQHQQDSRHY